MASSSSFPEQHARRVRLLVARLHEALVAEDNGAFLSKTGSLLKSKSMRTKKNKAIFKTILKACADEEHEGHVIPQKRFWTKALMKKALSELVSQYDLVIPQLPGFHWGTWLEKQATLFHQLAKKAHRNGIAMDNMETQPLDGREAPSMYIYIYPASYILYQCIKLNKIDKQS